MRYGISTLIALALAGCSMEPWSDGNPSLDPRSILYVATNGKDSNPGTAERPLRTIQTAIDAMPFYQADTVRVGSGYYYPGLGINLFEGQGVIVSTNVKSLSGGWNIGFTSQDGESILNLNGGSYLSTPIAITATNVNGLFIDNFTLIYGKATALWIIGTNTRVRNLKVSGYYEAYPLVSVSGISNTFDVNYSYNHGSFLITSGGSRNIFKISAISNSIEHFLDIRDSFSKFFDCSFEQNVISGYSGEYLSSFGSVFSNLRVISNSFQGDGIQLNPNNQYIMGAEFSYNKWRSAHPFIEIYSDSANKFALSNCVFENNQNLLSNYTFTNAVIGFSRYNSYAVNISNLVISGCRFRDDGWVPDFSIFGEFGYYNSSGFIMVSNIFEVASNVVLYSDWNNGPVSNIFQFNQTNSTGASYSSGNRVSADTNPAICAPWINFISPLPIAVTDSLIMLAGHTFSVQALPSVFWSTNDCAPIPAIGGANWSAALTLPPDQWQTIRIWAEENGLVSFTNVFRTIYLTNDILHVATNGNDSATGGASAPLQSIPLALRMAKDSGITDMRVQAGTYTPGNGFETGNAALTIRQNGLRLSGGWNADFSAADGMSVLDGQKGVLHLADIKDADDGVLTGFRLTGGYATNQVIWDSDERISPGFYGGGLLAIRADRWIFSNLIFLENMSYYSGGGFYLSGNSNRIFAVSSGNYSGENGGGGFIKGSKNFIEIISGNNFSLAGTIKINGRSNDLKWDSRNDRAYYREVGLASSDPDLFFHDSMISGAVSMQLELVSVQLQNNSSATLSNCVFSPMPVYGTVIGIEVTGTFGGKLLDCAFDTNSLDILFKQNPGSLIFSNANWTDLNTYWTNGPAFAAGNRVTNL